MLESVVIGKIPETNIGSIEVDDLEHRLDGGPLWFRPAVFQSREALPLEGLSVRAGLVHRPPAPLPGFSNLLSERRNSFCDHRTTVANVLTLRYNSKNAQH